MKPTLYTAFLKKGFTDYILSCLKKVIFIHSLDCEIFEIKLNVAIQVLIQFSF